LKKLKILIVDDALFMRTLLRETLEVFGHQIIGEAENGTDAIRQFDKLKPDLVFLDVVMPELSGLDALKDIIAKHPKAKIIMLSAVNQKQEIQKAMSLGATEFIIKPFENAQIERAILKAVS
jgi:two-component system chemotaxis response regulator CheY